ncbi:MAG: hypothetical protein K9N35_11745 [Candidatus Marinimicrobia bacterium]|nr:hypothetical protein [Candidatus Neomarinimicrobiota bacterium]
MKKGFVFSRFVICSIIIFSILIITNCSRDEENAHTLFKKADSLDLAGNVVGAYDAFKNVVLLYPETEVAKSVSSKIDSLAPIVFRFGIKYNPFEFPQRTETDLFNSVLKCIEQENWGYLRAHLWLDDNCLRIDKEKNSVVFHNITECQSEYDEEMERWKELGSSKSRIKQIKGIKKVLITILEDGPDLRDEEKFGIIEYGIKLGHRNYIGTKVTTINGRWYAIEFDL